MLRNADERCNLSVVRLTDETYMKILLLITIVIGAATSSSNAQALPTNLTHDAGVARHEKIDNIYSSFDEAYRKLDAELVSGLYAERALYLVPEQDLIRGRVAIRKEFESFFDWARKNGAQLSIRFRIIEREVSGNLGYDVGIYTLVTKIQNSESRESQGKFVVVTKKINGRWLFQLDGYNSMPKPVVEK